jgi:hypothetical protein
VKNCLGPKTLAAHKPDAPGMLADRKAVIELKLFGSHAEIRLEKKSSTLPS